jgi:hypothetical protein
VKRSNYLAADLFQRVPTTTPVHDSRKGICKSLSLVIVLWPQTQFASRRNIKTNKWHKHPQDIRKRGKKKKTMKSHKD